MTSILDRYAALVCPACGTGQRYRTLGPTHLDYFCFILRRTDPSVPCPGCSARLRLISRPGAPWFGWVWIMRLSLMQSVFVLAGILFEVRPPTLIGLVLLFCLPTVYFPGLRSLIEARLTRYFFEVERTCA